MKKVFSEDELRIRMIAHQKEQTVRNIKKYSTGIGDGGSCIPVRPELHQCKDVHGAVAQQIEIHGKKHHLRCIVFYRNNYTKRNAIVKHGCRANQQPELMPEINLLQIYKDEEKVGEHEGNAAEGKPLVPFWYQQCVTKPACQQCQRKRKANFIFRCEIIQQQKNQEKRLGAGTEFSIVHPGSSQMQETEYNKQEKENRFHSHPTLSDRTLEL